MSDNNMFPSYLPPSLSLHTLYQSQREHFCVFFGLPINSSFFQTVKDISPHSHHHPIQLVYSTVRKSKNERKTRPDHLIIFFLLSVCYFPPNKSTDDDGEGDDRQSNTIQRMTREKRRRHSIHQNLKRMGGIGITHISYLEKQQKKKKVIG